MVRMVEWLEGETRCGRYRLMMIMIITSRKGEQGQGPS